MNIAKGFVIGATILGSSLAFSQTTKVVENRVFFTGVTAKEGFGFYSAQFAPRALLHKSVLKRPGHYSADDWKRVIDSVWGPGLQTSEKLRIFDKVWSTIDTDFACFHDIYVNWDLLGSTYRAEVSQGVSRGRFAAIMSYLSMALKDAHTQVVDYGVCWSIALDPGVPLFLVGGNGDNSHFGAGLTPLPDSSLLVYTAVPGHPLGLVPGDVVLGYDRIPWRQLYKELIASQLPLVAGSWWGSSDNSFTHSMLMSAGMNWHLFDTIDVVKYASGDTLHLPTMPLINAKMNLFCTEQLDIPGIPKPNFNGGQPVSYGIITGTNIGYIYVWIWAGDAEQEFLHAVQALLNTDGLIIDFRTNYGGNMFLGDLGLALLFDTTMNTIGMSTRCNRSNREALCFYGFPSKYIIWGGPPPGYQKPIAVLTGPGAASAGDQVALRVRFHPRARTFGKPTSSTFNAPVSSSLGNADWFFAYAQADAYLLSSRLDPIYLTHEGFPVDYPTWHTPSAVAHSRDNVVDAARAWIASSSTTATRELPCVAQKFCLEQNYPNPFNPRTRIQFSVPYLAFVTLKVFNTLGAEIVTLVSKRFSSGTYEVDWNANGFPSGLYFYRLQAGPFIGTKKLILLK